MEREKESNKSRFLRLIVESHGSTILDGDSAPFYGFYPAQLQRLICLVEQETLERALMECEAMRDDMVKIKCSNQQIYGASQAVETIRSLKLPTN